MSRRLFGLATMWLVFVAATPMPPKPPPPDVISLVPFVSAPLDKPALQIARLAPPPPPIDVPPLPPATVVLPAASKPTAAVPASRVLPCAGAWLRISSESLECGRSKFAKGEFDEAARALEQVLRGTSNPDLLVDARYWLGETNYRLGRFEEADRLFRQVAADREAADLAAWAVFGSGFTALRLGDGPRALDAFRRLEKTTLPAPADTWVRHGLTLALYTLKQYDQAEKAWADLVQRRPASAGLERDALFWHAEALARLGRSDDAAREFVRFAQPGLHPLLVTSLLRQGWALRDAGKPAEAATVFRTYLGAPASPESSASERDWAELGLALTSIASADWNGASQHVNQLQSRRSPLALPARLRLAGGAIESGQAPVALSLTQDLLAITLTPAARAWVLLIKGEAHYADGNRDEARTQYELARGIDPASAVGRRATLRLAQTNFELREFAQALSDLAPLLSASMPPEIRSAALMLQGEAAYHAGNYAQAADAYRRVLVEFPTDGQTPTLRTALAWTALRQGRRDEALQQFLEVSRTQSGDPRAADALVLASELMLAAGNVEQARQLVERIMATQANHPHTDFVRLNHALLLARTGQAGLAQRQLRDWITRAPFPPLLGRAHAGLGATLLATGRPADAAREFAAAQREGVADLAGLGLGAVALAERRFDEATKSFTEARDQGSAPITRAAEYGLAVVAYEQGKTREFRPAAQAALDAAPRSPTAPRLLYVLAALGAEDKDWPAAVGYAKRLVTDFTDDEAADDVLMRVGDDAGKAGAWPVAYEMLMLLRQFYPKSPFVEDSRLLLAQAQLETGRAGEAQKALDDLVAAAPNDARAPQLLLALARAREAAGDRTGALDAFERAARTAPATAWTPETRLAHARLLSADKRWADARTSLEPVLHQSDPGLAAQAALAIGATFAGDGDQLQASEYYLSAAYLAPDAPAGRRALLEAGKALAALRQPDAAATVYRKLIAQSGVPADLAAAARQALADLKR